MSAIKRLTSELTLPVSANIGDAGQHGVRDVADAAGQPPVAEVTQPKLTSCTDAEPQIARARQTPADERRPSLESQLRRFDPRIRRRVRALVRQSPRVADLVHVFPGALHALADDATDAAARTRALAEVEAGGSLKAVSGQLGVPTWLRRLPPDAFRGPVPELPTSPHFVRRISTRMPRKRETAQGWLEAIAFAARASDEAFAIWVAERPEILPTDRPVPDALRALALYAWASRTEAAPAKDLVLTRWTPELQTARAICAAMSFLKRVDLMMSLSGVALTPWLEPGEVDGISFVPLTTSAELLEEARVMRNCVDHYARLLRENRCQLYSLRRDGTRIATLEIGPHAKEISTLTVTQLRGIANIRSHPDVWAAAYSWLASQPGRLVAERRPPMKPRGEAAVWSQVFDAYFAAHPDAHWWPRTVDVQGLWTLASDLAAVARKARVASWQFG